MFDWDNVKEDDRPKRFGWAPGGYTGICDICDSSFIGDKRASICADCAYDLPDEPVETYCCSRMHIEVVKGDDITDFKYCPWCGTKL